MEQTYKKIRDLNPVQDKKLYGAYSLEVEYLNLLMNAVKINGLDYKTENFVKKMLLRLGRVGYDKMTGKFAQVWGVGINELGDPTTLTFRFINGKTYRRPACYDNNPNGAYLIEATPLDFSFASMIRNTTLFMENCNIATEQNINACKTPYIVTCKNKDLLLSLKHALQEKDDGQAAIIVDEEIGDGLKSIKIDTEFLADKFLMVRDSERDKLLNKLGIMSANINKKERVQVGEVNTTLNQCTDYIYLLIDTFNKQMETYDLPFEMVLNESLEELYNPGEDTEEVTEEVTEERTLENG